MRRRGRIPSRCLEWVRRVCVGQDRHALLIDMIHICLLLYVVFVMYPQMSIESDLTQLST